MESIWITGKRFLDINFLRLIHPEIIIRELSLAHHKENEGQFHKQQGRHQETGSVPQATGTGTSFARNEEQNRDTIPNFCRFLWLYSNYCRYPSCNSFSCWKVRFKNQATTCSDFPPEAMLWIKEVEMVDSLDELKSSRSVSGNNFPKLEMLDAKIASALNTIIPNYHFKKKVSLEEQKSSERVSVPERETNRLHDVRLFSSNWS